MISRGVSKIQDGEDLWQWSRQEIRLNVFTLSIVLQKKWICLNLLNIRNESRRRFLSLRRFRYDKDYSDYPGLVLLKSSFAYDKKRSNFTFSQGFSEKMDFQKFWKINKTKFGSEPSSVKLQAVKVIKNNSP